MTNISRDDLDASYAFCRRISRRSGSNFYLGFLLLPREKRRAMDALYAFMRHTDDMVDVQSNPADHPDNPGMTIDKRRYNLKLWREGLKIALQSRERLFAYPASIMDSSYLKAELKAMYLFPALVDTVKKFYIPKECLHDVLDGVEMDLERCTYQTFDELKLYCRRVASAVGLACIHIWGFRGQGTPDGDAAIEVAQHAGIALQLTNILRDLKADAADGRVYLPLEDLRACGYSVEELKKGAVNEAFYRLMNMEIVTAEKFYREGFKLMDLLDRDGRRIFGLMMATYHALLEQIALQPECVFSRPVHLGKFRRFMLAARWAMMPSAMLNKMKISQSIKQ